MVAPERKFLEDSEDRDMHVFLANLKVIGRA